tara:strand:+ start:239 stop:877 length:639 start_codon:yes stop_codon:yes gene_type:complete
MIRLLFPLPVQLTVAVSGGPDSMAGLDFLSRNRKVTAAYFNHGTPHSKVSQNLVEKFCEERKIDLEVGSIQKPRQKQSLEEYWREERYNFFEKIEGPIITCHHLDDSVEWWLFSSFNGNPKLIPYRRGKYLRPFLLNRKSTLVEWCERKNVRYIIDPSNNELAHARNLIRRRIIPNVELVNPGIHTVIKKKIIDSYQSAHASRHERGCHELG